MSLRIQLALLDAYDANISGRGGRGLVDTAGRYLTALTEGRYTAYVPSIDDDGDRLIRILRDDPDGGGTSEMNLVELSEGNADQAFLTLRLAGMRERLTAIGGQAPPVVLDDVLMAFDDQRSHAALKLLAELGEEHQILLLTHHRRLLDQAESIDGIPMVELARSLE